MLRFLKASTSGGTGKQKMADTLTNLRNTFLHHSGAVALMGALSFYAQTSDAEEQRLSLHNTHKNESLNVVYKRDGKYVPEAMKQITHLLRDRMNGSEKDISPQTLDRLYAIGQKFKVRYPDVPLVFQIVSGYRSPSTNETLRNTKGRGGQAQGSRHLEGKALDYWVKGIPNRESFNIAYCTGKGGTGYYVRDRVVHIDPDVNPKTGNNRVWHDAKDKDLLPRGWRDINCAKYQ